jgi:hypothetical protein
MWSSLDDNKLGMLPQLMMIAAHAHQHIPEGARRADLAARATKASHTNTLSSR